MVNTLAMGMKAIFLSSLSLFFLVSLLLVSYEGNKCRLPSADADWTFLEGMGVVLLKRLMHRLTLSMLFSPDDEESSFGFGESCGSFVGDSFFSDFSGLVTAVCKVVPLVAFAGDARAVALRASAS
jgi:hypothetical protein